MMRLMRIDRVRARMGISAGVYMSAVVEYIAKEILELSLEETKKDRKKRIIPRHIKLAVGTDDELNKIFCGAIIHEGGSLPSIHPALLKKEKGAKNVAPSNN